MSQESDERPPVAPPAASRPTSCGWLPTIIIVLVVLGLCIIMRPDLNGHLSTRAIEAANLRGIGQAIHMYTDQYGDVFPPDPESLLNAGFVTKKQLLSPHLDRLPSNDELIWDFHFVVDQAGDSPRSIMAYSDPLYNDGAGANILYVDGHVEFVSEPEFSVVIERFLNEFEQQHNRLPRIVEPR